MKKTIGHFDRSEAISIARTAKIAAACKAGLAMTIRAMICAVVPDRTAGWGFDPSQSPRALDRMSRWRTDKSKRQNK